MTEMAVSLGEVLISVWRQALIENARTITLESGRLREVDFEFDGQKLRGLEQNPNTNSRWAQLAREGKKVMQFLNGGKYIANVVDGKVKFYGR